MDTIWLDPRPLPAFTSRATLKGTGTNRFQSVKVSYERVQAFRPIFDFKTLH